MVIQSRTGQPKANSQTVISSDERTDIIELLYSLGEIPVHCFTLLYKFRYDKILDCLEKRVEGGLLGYLKNILDDVIKIRTDLSGNMYVSLNQAKSDVDVETKENIKPLLRKRQYEREIKAFFNPNSILWKGRLSMLDRRNLRIESSLFEQAKMVREKEFYKEVKRIRGVLCGYPNGIEEGKFGYILEICHKVFPGMANNHKINDLPELFYKINRKDKEPLLFDGFTKTIKDLSGENDELFGRYAPEIIVEDVLRNGLFQKSLILMREKGVAGLKIQVWERSMERNFYENKSANDKKDLYKYSPLEFFMALARFGLVKVSSGEGILNDLRAFIPSRKPEEAEPIFERFCKQRSHSVF